MTVYEYLEQARALNKRIELDKEVLRRIQEETYSVRGISYDKEKVMSGEVSDLSGKVERLESIKEKLEKEIRKSDEVREKSFDYIVRIYKPSLIRDILIARYIGLARDWQEIADSLHYARQSVKDRFGKEKRILMQKEWKD